MKLRPDFAAYLYELRHREFSIIFGACPMLLFGQALELGAGRALQSTLLSTRARSLICSDFKPAILEQPPQPRIEFRVCDAERVAETFPAQAFDLVYSSNLLEHLPDLDRALRGMHDVLKDDGVAIHVMPSPFFKLLDLGGYYPRQVVVFLEGITKKGGFGRLKKKFQVGGKPPIAANKVNNLKLDRPRRSFLHKLVWPAPHGVSRRHRDEFYAFSARRWQQVFARNGFTVVKVKKGPVFSGHGFGMRRARAMLESAGLTSEYVYIATKTGHQSPYVKFFCDP